ncbi:MAG: class I SAM-dependent methyltransferase [Mucilaginibacter sp.]
MDEVLVKKAMFSLKWEAEYKKRFEQKEYTASKFLAVEDYLDADFARFFDNPKFMGSTILDIGTGTGEQAIYLAKKGFKVTATDTSGLAINYAKQQALQQNAQVNFIQDNILLTTLNQQFDFVIDRGCFILFAKEQCSEYLSIIKKLLKPTGWFLLKADNGKKKRIKILEDDTELNIKTTEFSSYTRLDGKDIPALFFSIKHASNQLP